MFKGHCFPKAIILQAVYFKLRFGLSYRDVEELLSIRGVKVDHATIQRWVFKFTPLVEQQFKPVKFMLVHSFRHQETIIISELEPHRTKILLICQLYLYRN